MGPAICVFVSYTHTIEMEMGISWRNGALIPSGTNDVILLALITSNEKCACRPALYLLLGMLLFLCRYLRYLLFLVP